MCVNVVDSAGLITHVADANRKTEDMTDAEYFTILAQREQLKLQNCSEGVGAVKHLTSVLCVCLHLETLC